MTNAAPQVYETVVDAIQQQIADGRWLPGQRLPSITQLASDLGVSTGSVREAARVLATRGVLRIEHGRGTFVAAAGNVSLDIYEHFEHVDATSTIELFEARRLLEPELASLAAERGSDEEVARISLLAAQMEAASLTGEDFFEPDIQFHQQIAAAARNTVLASIMSSISDLIIEGRKLTVLLPGMTARAVRYHLLIAEAIRERRPLQARLLMLAHVNDALDALVQMYPARRGAPIREATFRADTLATNTQPHGSNVPPEAVKGGPANNT
jgi:GntR family transcriptional repressor for pyruvate dehydrogenase complex